jgi:hypothetical protein
MNHKSTSSAVVMEQRFRPLLEASSAVWSKLEAALAIQVERSRVRSRRVAPRKSVEQLLAEMALLREMAEDIQVQLTDMTMQLHCRATDDEDMVNRLKLKV